MRSPAPDCPDCGGYGIFGGKGSYYDTPGRGKPCPCVRDRRSETPGAADPGLRAEADPYGSTVRITKA